MVTKYDIEDEQCDDIQADVIVLGCSLPGIVTAHKLKRKFGDTMDIVVIDLASAPTKGVSKIDMVTFFDDDIRGIDKENEGTTLLTLENYSRRFLLMYAKEFNITIPNSILYPAEIPSTLNKLFEYTNGSTVQCTNNFHDFDYLNVLEKFELNQYQRLIEESMRHLFRATRGNSEFERQKLLYYDRTTMENHICGALLFSTSREIMRTLVRLVCGVPPSSVSVLFYLHQCYRNNGCRDYVDGSNTKFREKLMGYCRKRIAHKLQESVADITLQAKSIKEIRTHSDEQVILETMKGENNYVCRLLAMALRPDQLYKIHVEPVLLSEKNAEVAQYMLPGQVKKFTIQYETDFWRTEGFSGEILSIRGPIVWAMERPSLSGTGSKTRYSYLVGYLAKQRDEDGIDSKQEVIEQLVRLFGEYAANPVSYKESDVDDLFIPKCGDYIALRSWTKKQNLKLVEWGALDIYRDGDVTGALEAGHSAFLRLSSWLRPQAQSFDDVSTVEFRSNIHGNFCSRILSQLNIIKSISLFAYTAVLYLGIRLLKSQLKQTHGN